MKPTRKAKAELCHDVLYSASSASEAIPLLCHFVKARQEILNLGQDESRQQRRPLLVTLPLYIVQFERHCQGVKLVAQRY